MSKNKNTIKINGHTYDAVTGALISHGPKVAAKPVHKKVERPLLSTTRSVAPTAKAIHHTSKPAVVRSKAKHPSSGVAKDPSPTKHSSVARPPSNNTGRTIQHSETLMRHAVKKPSTTTTKHLKAHSHTGALVKNGIAAKPSVHRVDEQRLQHAKNVSKSNHITRFSKTPLLQHVPVTVTPHTPVVKHLPKPLPKPHTPAPHHKSTSDMLQHALQHANSHKQPPPKRHMSRAQRITSFSALTVTTAVVLGFVAFQNLPTLQVHIASAKAGFAASLPGYNAAGFHLGDLNYGAGVVAMNYKSNSDQTRKYAITQKSSSWDSNTLRDTFVAGKDKNFQVVEDGGRTIFIYNQNNATWVDNGIWYQVQGTGALSNRQLIDIAKSL